LLTNHALAWWAVETLCVLARLFTNISFLLAERSFQSTLVLLTKSIQNIMILRCSKIRRIVQLALLMLVSLDSVRHVVLAVLPSHLLSKVDMRIVVLNIRLKLVGSSYCVDASNWIVISLGFLRELS